ncbi:MAG: hypothetical protein L3K15_05135 [Thermoplasmata archaeon]|nr:hypothetical protein [Thermoplasmata archaeon]
MRSGGVEVHGDPHGAAGTSAVVVALLLTVLIASVMAPAQGTYGKSNAPRFHIATVHTVRPSGGHTSPPHLGLVGKVHPLQASDFYTQEGMTIAETNGANTVGVATLTENVRAVTSPYPIAYELNGLTDVGDWVQITLDDNWPGCPGFAELMEVWSNTQGSGPVVCDTTISYSAGDMIQLELNFTSSGNICMDFTKVATNTKHVVCQAPPDAGATKWIFLNTLSNTNGFYTGPMTEIINQTASACPDYTIMPALTYLYPTNFVVTQETPWSDEFNLFGGACYISGYGLDTYSPGDMTTHYFDTASGTGFGPHWSGGQNFSMVNASFGWRYETDPNAITSVTPSAYPALVLPGHPSTLNATIVGGATPLQTLWYLNGTSLGYHPVSWSWTAPAVPGQYVFTVYAIDAEKNVFGPSGPVTVNVVGPLTATGISLSPLTGTLDLGQSVTFIARYSGGIPPYHFAWSGLPSGCSSSDLPRLACTPTAIGQSSVQVAVTDSNGSLRHAGPVTIQVVPDPSVSLVASGASFDLGSAVILTASASGGTGTYTYTWSFLPPGCTSLNASRIRCVPIAPGGFGVYVTANDTSGFSTFGGPASFSIAPDPSVTVHVNRSQVEVNESLMISAIVQGGSGGVVLSWTGLPTGCVASNLSQIVCTLSGSGNFNIGASVRDAAGYSSRAPPVQVQVFPMLTARLSAQPTSVASGGSTVLSLNASGGIPNLAFHWNGLPGTCVLNSNRLTATCTATPAGTYTVQVLVTDSTGVARSTSVTFTVLPGPSGNSGGLLGGGIFLPLLIALVLVVAILGIALAVRSRRRPPPEPAVVAEIDAPWGE